MKKATEEQGEPPRKPYPWDHQITSSLQMNWTRSVKRRWPRLHRLVRVQGNLTSGESSACIRDYVQGRDGASAEMLRFGGGEAVVHYGGPWKLVLDAVRRRPSIDTHYRQSLRFFAKEMRKGVDPQ